MTRKTTMKFALLALPIAAIAALALFLTLGSSGSHQAHAQANYTGTLSIGSCTGPKCSVGIGQQYTVNVAITAGTDPVDGFEIDLVSSTGNCKSANSTAAAAFWPGQIALSSCITATTGSVAASKGTTDTSASIAQTSAGVGAAVFNCTQSGSITKDNASFVVNATTGNSDAIDVAGLQVNCVTPTATNTPTSTATPLPGIQMQKCYTAARGNQCVQNTNLFLQNRNPSQFCNAGESVVLHEGLSNMPPNNPQIKGQEGLGSYQFDVYYDAKKVCLDINANPSGATGLVCTVIDQGKGQAHVGCVTVGKTQLLTAELATITVHVNKETVQQIRPNQDNGNATQIQDINCQISDLQGHQINLLSCEDAELSIRFLEGDVVPNCAVDAGDLANEGMRWGAAKGSQLYQSFFDLSPSGQFKGDNRIDIQDLQAVFGRFGSTCTNQWPAQPPFSDKK